MGACKSLHCLNSDLVPQRISQGPKVVGKLCAKVCGQGCLNFQPVFNNMRLWSAHFQQYATAPGQLQRECHTRLLSQSLQLSTTAVMPHAFVMFTARVHRDRRSCLPAEALQLTEKAFPIKDGLNDGV